MIYLIGAISLVSLALNILIYKRITATYPVGVLEEFETEKIEPEPEPEEPEEEIVPEAPVKPVENQSNYQGWVNRSGIPIVDPIKPPAQIKEPVNRAPLARPDGFV